MKCERCGAATIGPYDLHDYCELCSKNLCTGCMATGVCSDERSKDKKHQPSIKDDDA